LVNECYGDSDRVAGYWQPTASDIRHLETRLSELLRAGKVALHNRSLNHYFRQYIGIKVQQRSLVCLNAVSADFLDLQTARCSRLSLPDREASEECHPGYWQQHAIVVDDGGDSLWRILYDPITQEFEGFSVNGEA